MSTARTVLKWFTGEQQIGVALAPIRSSYEKLSEKVHALATAVFSPNHAASLEQHKNTFDKFQKRYKDKIMSTARTVLKWLTGEPQIGVTPDPIRSSYEKLSEKVLALATVVFSPNHAASLEQHKKTFDKLQKRYTEISSSLPPIQQVALGTLLNTIETQFAADRDEEAISVSDNEEDVTFVQEQRPNTPPPKRARIEDAKEPVGIKRHGNNCCMIAPMQLIRCIDGFTDHISSVLFPSWKNFNGDDRTLRKPFVKLYPQEFTKTRQQDAQEVLLKLIDTMPQKFNNLTVQALEATTYDPKDLTGFSEALIEEQKQDGRITTHSIIPLTLTPEANHSFLPLLLNFLSTKKEELPTKTFKEGEIKKDVQASSLKRTLMGSLPEHLLFSFVRFDYSKSKKAASKNNSLIKDIPLTCKLDPSFLANPELPQNTNKDYELTGFIVHEGGSLNSGHYYTLVKKGETWYLCNDDTVTKVTEETVKKELESSYILLYSKK